MATTSPDNLRTPDPGDPYNLVPDLATLAGDVQAALLLRDNNTGSGTASQRTAFTSTAPDGFLWQDTDGIKMIWRKDGAVWVPAVWRWAGTATQMNAFTQAPNGFEWFNTSDNFNFIKEQGFWVSTSPLIAQASVIGTSTPPVQVGGVVTGGAALSLDVTVQIPTRVKIVMNTLHYSVGGVTQISSQLSGATVINGAVDAPENGWTSSTSLGTSTRIVTLNPGTTTIQLWARAGGSIRNSFAWVERI